MYIYLNRKKAFRLSWMIFKMATTSKHLKLSLDTCSTEDLVIVEGDAVIEGETPS